MEKILMAKEFLESKHIEGSKRRCGALIEFAKLHVEKCKELQQCKYYAGESGYITKKSGKK